LNLLTITIILQALRWPHMKFCMDGNVFLHCVGKYLVSDFGLGNIGYNRLMVRYIRFNRIC
jgi:hypothetical protein